MKSINILEPPKDLWKKINCEISNLESLKLGQNNGKILSAKILAALTEKGAVPA